MIGPGGGVNLSRKKGQKSAKVANANIEVRKALKAAQDTLNKEPVKAGVPNGLVVHLVEENGQLIVKDASGAFRATLPQLAQTWLTLSFCRALSPFGRSIHMFEQSNSKFRQTD